jgi:D-alanyl-D-alanine carboxypeptidase
VPGTSANLGENMQIKLLDLLYALMLPSGNDASLVLANYLGSYCKKKKIENQSSTYKSNKLKFIG